MRVLVGINVGVGVLVGDGVKVNVEVAVGNGVVVAVGVGLGRGVNQPPQAVSRIPSQDTARRAKECLILSVIIVMNRFQGLFPYLGHI